MNLPTKSRVLIADSSTYSYIAMTDWIAGIHATHASMLMLLREETGAWGAIAAVQFALTDTDTPRDWIALTGSPDPVTISNVGRVTTTFLDVTGAGTYLSLPEGTDNNMWVRFGIGVALTSGTDPQRGEIDVSVQVRT